MLIKKMVLTLGLLGAMVGVGVLGFVLPSQDIEQADASTGSPYWERVSNGTLHYPNAGADLYIMPGYRDNVANSGVTTLEIPGNKWLRVWDNFSVAGWAEVVDEGKAAGSPLLQIGDDTFFTDVDWANTTGLYGVQNSYEAGIVLGRGGYNNRTGVKGSANGDICIGKCY